MKKKGKSTNISFIEQDITKMEIQCGLNGGEEKGVHTTMKMVLSINWFTER